jgi:SWI/SNF-related matrix-associated actin-dependent regulator of chromatin subfamily A member 5
LLAYLAETNPQVGCHIVIVPKSTVSNWEREFKKWCPTIRTIRLLGTKEERQHVCKNLLKPGKFDVLIASYESCLKEKSSIMKIQWNYLIIDEAHRLKNENSSLSIITRLFLCQHRLLITGTPLQVCLLSFLDPTPLNAPPSLLCRTTSTSSGLS